jgi:hypothetical protein
MGAPDASRLGIRRASRSWKANLEPDVLAKFQPIWPNFGHDHACVGASRAHLSLAVRYLMPKDGARVCYLILCTKTWYSGRFGGVNEENLAKTPSSPPISRGPHPSSLNTPTHSSIHT